MPKHINTKMPTIYLRKDLYDEIATMKKDISAYVNEAVASALHPKEQVKRSFTRRSEEE